MCSTCDCKKRVFDMRGIVIMSEKVDSASCRYLYFAAEGESAAVLYRLLVSVTVVM